MSERRLLVINPNSNPRVTAGIDASVDADRLPGTLRIDCMTLDGAPFGIESAADIDAVVPMLAAAIDRRLGAYDAVIIACYSDPGLQELRERFDKPLLGIQESAALLSASRERRFGVLALSAESVERHVAYIHRLGLAGLHAGERPINVSVDDAARDAGVLEPIVTAGRQLIDEDGAELLILGCAGMARHRRSAEARLGVPVIDPVQAAVTLARKAHGRFRHSPAAAPGLSVLPD